jgi:predicted dehydrogenase
VGLIGPGWYGKSAVLRLLQVEPVTVTALCDVDTRMLNEAADLFAVRQPTHQRPRIYTDYREMLKKEPLDIVHVATPDHWHALAAIAAIKAGADVYVEKPISVDVVEGQAMLAAARKYKRVVQVGLQRRSTPHVIEARDRFIKTGRLGTVGMVEMCSYYHMRFRGNPEPQAPPESLDYDFWTGPAPMLPFTPNRHPRGWRAYMEYGNGIMGDMGVHMFDMTRWMLDLGWPARISSSGGILVDKASQANIADTQTATFDYGDTTVLWQHRTWGRPADEKYPWSAIFYGDKGTLKVSVMGYDFIPQGKGTPEHVDVKYELDEYPEDKTEKDLERHVAPALRGHMANFLHAIDTRTLPVSDIGEGHISSASCILANLAMKTGRTLVWDAEAGCVTGDDEANRLLQRPYRSPWIHPDPATV